MSKMDDTKGDIANAKETKDNQDQDIKNCDAESYKSSSSELKYQSSSAESIGRPNDSGDDEKKSSKSTSRSRSRSSSRLRSNNFSGRFNDRRSRIDFRRHRPFNKFRHDNSFDRKNRNFNKYNNNRYNSRNSSTFRRFNSPSKSYDDRKKSRHVDSVEKKHGSKYRNKNEDSDKQANSASQILKPSDIKNNAKQSTQTFLAMLEEKKRNLAFNNKPIVQPVETKKISVKIHGFVNTFNSINNKNCENDVLQSTPHDIEADSKSSNSKDKSDFNNDSNSSVFNQERKKCSNKRKNSDSSNSDDSSSEEAVKKKKKSKDVANFSANSSREEGEIRSDLEKKNKAKTHKKNKNLSLESKSDNDKKRKKIQKKKAKKKSKKKKRHHSSSSSSTSTSFSSGSSSQSDYSDYDSPSSSSSSDSSSYKKKSKKKKKDKKKSKKRRKIKEKLRKRKSKEAKKSKKLANEKLEAEKIEPNSDNNSDKQGLIENWPKELITFTKTEPSIQFSMNPKFAKEILSDDNANPGPEVALKSEYQKFINELDQSKNNTSESIKQKNIDSTSDTSIKSSLPFIGKMKGLNKKSKSKSLLIKSEPMKLDLNYDYNYYYQYYYANGFPSMDQKEQHIAASYSAYYHMFNSYDYTQQQLAQWASQQGYNLIETNKYEDKYFMDTSNDLKTENDTSNSKVNESNDNKQIKTENNDENDNINVTKENSARNSYKIEVITTNQISSNVSSDFIKNDFNSKTYPTNGVDGHINETGINSPPLSPPPPRPKMSFLETTESITLPNGVTLPPGTKQIIVHPYNRPVY